MYSLFTAISQGELFKRQLPLFLAALMIAELFYKFHSFTLECIGFLATWYVLDRISQLLWPRHPDGREGDAPPQ